MTYRIWSARSAAVASLVGGMKAADGDGGRGMRGDTWKSFFSSRLAGPEARGGLESRYR